MLLKLFKSNLPYVVVIIPILGILLWLPALFPEISAKTPIHIDHVSPLYRLLTGFLNTNYYLSTITALVICILQSYYLIRLNFKYIFIESKTYLPAVLFVLFSSIFYANQALQPALLANFLILLAIDKSFVIDKERHQFKRYYESGFFIGLAALIYPLSLCLLLVIWISQLILRTFNGREFLSSILGALTPMAFYFALAFLNDNLIATKDAYLQIFNYQAQTSIANNNIIATIIIATLFLIALLFSLRIIATKKISSRKYFSMFVWILIISLLMHFTLLSSGTEISYFLAIPLSIIFTLFFIELRRRLIAEIFFTILFIAIIICIWF